MGTTNRWPCQNEITEKRNAEAPDIIILDIMLPGKDGLEVLREIRGESQVPVIMLTPKGDDAELERIFEPFYRAQGGPAEGFGLGLAITKAVIEAHGGRIHALNGEKSLVIEMALPV